MFPAGSESSVCHQEEKEKESLLYILVSQDFDSFASFLQLGLALYTSLPGVSHSVVPNSLRPHGL